MPTYLYECPIHGEFEHMHSITEELEECPKCREENKPSQKVKRLIAGGTGFILNGGGWASEGYK
ncbi:MAG: FmdB family zinc ribbon protein [Nitrosotalea sp.]